MQRYLVHDSHWGFDGDGSRGPIFLYGAAPRPSDAGSEQEFHTLPSLACQHIGRDFCQIWCASKTALLTESFKPSTATLRAVGNEGNVEAFANFTGLMWEHAARFRALLLFAEVRETMRALASCWQNILVHTQYRQESHLRHVLCASTCQ